MSEWIRVEDKLPESRRKVVALSAGKVEYIAYTVPRYDESMWRWAHNDDTLYEITHWMPLPEPPKSLSFLVEYLDANYIKKHTTIKVEETISAENGLLEWESSGKFNFPALCDTCNNHTATIFCMTHKICMGCYERLRRWNNE